MSIRDSVAFMPLALRSSATVVPLALAIFSRVSPRFTVTDWGAAGLAGAALA